MDFSKRRTRRRRESRRKSDDFTHCQITYFQFNLPPPGQHKTIERKTIILLRTNKERRKTEWNGEERPPSESRPCKDENGMRGTNFRNEKVRGMARKDNRYHCRGGPDHEILPVIPDPTYTNSGVQSSTDNRTGYVVDLAGNIYELLLPRSFLFPSFSFCHLLTSIVHAPFFFNKNIEIILHVVGDLHFRLDENFT